MEKISQSANPLVGTNIKCLRLKNNMKNTDVVAKLQLAGIKMTTSTLSKIERGGGNPSTDMLIALTEIFHCDFNAFFSKEQELNETKNRRGRK